MRYCMYRIGILLKDRAVLKFVFLQLLALAGVIIMEFAGRYYIANAQNLLVRNSLILGTTVFIVILSLIGLYLDKRIVRIAKTKYKRYFH